MAQGQDPFDPGLFDSGRAAALALSGGGAAVLSRLFGRPGASRLLVEAQVPYHGAALEEYLGSAGPHRVVGETARRMAQVAWQRALRMDGRPAAVGVGCTAALATDRARRGADRAHIAARSADEYCLAALGWEKGTPRDREEAETAAAVEEALRWACGLGEGPAGAEVWPVSRPLEELLDGVVDALEVKAGMPARKDGEGGRLVFPGSFNPLHEGHAELAAVAAETSGLPAVLEISVENVDKPALGYAEVWRRIRGVGGRFPLCLTRAPTFAQKARLFPGCVFVIGADTAARLLEGRYYEGADGMRRALGGIGGLGCSFLVAGRLCDGRFLTLDDLEVPAEFGSLFSAIPTQAFRRDISSSELRAAAAAGR